MGARPERLRELILANPGRRDVVIDEIQRVPDLLPVVHDLIESRADVRFVLTGSSARKLRRGATDLFAAANDPADVLGAYATLYLEQEVQFEGLVRSIGSFARFLETVSFSHGSVLNVSNVARESQINRKTSILESFAPCGRAGLWIGPKKLPDRLWRGWLVR